MYHINIDPLEQVGHPKKRHIKKFNSNSNGLRILARYELKMSKIETQF